MLFLSRPGVFPGRAFGLRHALGHGRLSCAVARGTFFVQSRLSLSIYILKVYDTLTAALIVQVNCAYALVAHICSRSCQSKVK